MKKYLTIMGILFALSIVLWVMVFFRYTQTEENNTDRNNDGLIVTDDRVFDMADLLSEGEEDKLLQRIKVVREKYCSDIVILTTADAEGKSAMEYADDFYDTHDFGYEDAHGTGILFLVDMDNREIWFSTSGRCIDYYSSSRIDAAIDRVYNDLVEGRYYQVFDGCIDSVEQYVSLEDESKIIVEIVEGAIFSGVVTVVLLLILIISRGGKVTVSSSTYLVAASKEVYERSDIHYDTVVTTRTIVQDNGGGRGGGSSGGSHISSGGFTHGGGGRSF